MKKSDPPIIIENRINASLETVWMAITEVMHMRNWFFKEIHEFRAEVGFETKFTVHSDDRAFPHVWTIIDVIPRNKISYNWKYEGYKGDSNVHFELVQVKTTTKIKLTTEILDDFQTDVPEFKRESCEGGWKYFLCDRLPDYLESLNNQ
ncbi:MAG: SRPBCC domain-containing protein [Saprospiraceae bacterium]|nr:SRPBCC domain-containing protein [Saprospiraceae bacterium]